MAGKKSTFINQGSAAYTAPYPPGNMAVATSANTIPHVKDSTGGNWEHGQNFGFSRGPAPSSAVGSIYIEDPVAGDGCKQINGASIEISPGSEQLMSHISVPHQVRIIRPVNVGDGDQVNGVDLKTIGEVGAFAAPFTNIACLGPRAYPVISNGKAFGGTQINGYRSRRRSKRRTTTKKDRK